MAIADYEGYLDPDDETVEECMVPDPAWEQQQKKTFTAWCNSHLRKATRSIDDIGADFRDGLRLMTLLEVISGEHLGKPDRGKMRFHKIANVNKALEFIESKGVKLVSIGAEEIVDGNVKMTLGMIWTIILRFAIQDIQIENSTAREGLLLWCRKQTAGYKNVNVTDFSTSFKDGLAFCAIIHNNRRDLLRYDELSPDNALHNLNTAFNVAERELDIPRMLDPDDMVNSVKPDERSVMAYLSSYYHAFSGANKITVAGNRISNMIRSCRENARLINEYETLSSDLLAWIEKKHKYFTMRTPPLTLVEADKLEEEYRTYDRVEKPEKLREKARLETAYSTLQTRLRLSKRDPYIPAIDKHISTISEKWVQLDEVSRDFKDWLLGIFQMLYRFEYLLKKFKVLCTTHEDWAAGKPEFLKSDRYLKCTLPELRAFIKRHEVFQSEVAANDDRRERIRMLHDELRNLGYHNMTAITGRYNSIVATTEEIKYLSDACEKKLQELLPVLEKIDELHLEFAKSATSFKNWAKQTEEDLRDMPTMHTMSEVQRYVEAHRMFEKTLGVTENECNTIGKRAKDVAKLAQQYHLVAVTDNPYIIIKPEELEERFENIKKLTDDRSRLLLLEEQKQTKNEKLCCEFAQKSADFDKWLKDSLNQITNHTTSREPLDKQCEHLRILESKLIQHKAALDDLERCNLALEDALVFENPHTSLSMLTLRVAWDQLFTNLHHTQNLIENKLLSRNSKALSPEQLAELRASFRHFDRSKNGRLEPAEFHACLLSIGHGFRDDLRNSLSGPVSNLSGPASGDSQFVQAMKIVDPDNKGYVTFDAFVDYIAREQSTEDTDEQLIESFNTIAGDKGYLTIEDIERTLPPEDAVLCQRFLVRLNGPMGDSGGLDYKKFVKDIYTSRCL